MAFARLLLLGFILALGGCSLLVAGDLECETDADCGDPAVCKEGVCKGGVWQIGGRVSGMKGKQLLLSCGTDELELPGNGVFLFPTKYANRTAYEVKVARQPVTPSETCTVAHGTGTVAAETVWSVAVTCATNTYTIGGTVAGLLPGTTVTLANTGGEQLTVSANGSFAFPAPFADGSPYAVTVATSSPVLTCVVVSGGSGSVAGGPVTAPQVECTAHTWELAGHVYGLEPGSQVVLANAGQTRTVTAEDPTFSFGALLEGSSYEVTVLTQPAQPRQRCTVGTGGSGTLQQAATNVEVDCEKVFVVGGAITGLAGTGLVLALNETEQSAIAAGGAEFLFGTLLAAEASYAVTVATQPTSPDQTCTLGAATGTIAEADVSSVSVTCAPGYYKVGGTIAGLSSAGLVLQIDGASDLTVPADATSFTFPTLLQDGSSHTVTVLTQPASPTQTCTITAGTEAVTLAAGDATTVAVVCKSHFAVGGTITGTLGDGLVLRLNGVDLEVPAGASSFVFPEPLVDGSTYAVAVQAQPTTPAQTCTVSAGAGTLAGAAISDVAVSCVDDPV